ncbi:MAG TPA: bifunctional 3-demethylubiquinol 3-O-methyltransferase/2-polyprenyl-6-hydroxyphenol methylase, partial [Burkholderiaceae bacterium]|nr:bifunctional 3-demethylubiquinol 3-O-methyltransferase/2-polyprenyl-6-hydroxyphenol methylase [Burkholderiaceae bacterium]
PRGTHEYAKLIKPSELSRFARMASLEVRTIVGVRYNPFTHVATLADDTDVNYMMACRKPA